MNYQEEINALRDKISKYKNKEKINNYEVDNKRR